MELRIPSLLCRVKFALNEKDVPYDSVLINLYSKPEWCRATAWYQCHLLSPTSAATCPDAARNACRYKEMVPTMLTPAAKINGELVWESMDILRRLEREFTERPLLPADAHLAAEAEEVIADAEPLSAAGFKWGACTRPVVTAACSPHIRTPSHACCPARQSRDTRTHASTANHRERWRGSSS